MEVCVCSRGGAHEWVRFGYRESAKMAALHDRYSMNIDSTTRKGCNRARIECL